MPMRAYRASTAYAGAHVRDNFGYWIAGAAAVAAILGLIAWVLGGRGVAGDAFILATLVFGILIMIRSQRSNVSPEDEEEMDTAATRTAKTGVPQP
jgi:apolipoprotein N-acyltransferase